MEEANRKPKKALNAYFKYRNKWLEADTKKNPTTDFKDRTARYNKAWKSIDAKKKENFEAQYYKELAEYNVKIIQWNKDHPEEKEDKKAKKGKNGKSKARSSSAESPAK